MIFQKCSSLDKRLKTFLTLCLESQVVCRKIFHMVRSSMKSNSYSSLSHQYILYIIYTIITIELNQIILNEMGSGTYILIKTNLQLLIPLHARKDAPPVSSQPGHYETASCGDFQNKTNMVLFWRKLPHELKIGIMF